MLGLGSSLHVAGTETGVLLPYALVAQTPLLGLLRMSNRFFVVTQLAFAVLCAAAWKDVSHRRAGPRTRAIGGTAVATAIALELTCVPLRTFRAEASAYLADLAASPTVRTLVELPIYHASSFLNGSYVFHQTLHEKKIPQGYVTALAVSEDAVGRGGKSGGADSMDAVSPAAILASRGGSEAPASTRSLATGTGEPPSTI